MIFSLVEKLLLAVLVAASAARFGRDLWRKIEKIRQGKADRIRTDHQGVRWRRVLSEVVFQSRVVGGRPIVGLLHAVVFFGFLTFGLATVDHFLAGFGVAFLAPLLGGALTPFRSVLAAFAIAVSLAIFALAFRRFILVRQSPDPRSWSSGVVAAFILLLMLTYLNGARPQPLFAKANWWAHAAIILVFPQLILRSKHFHILMAPVAIWFRTPRLGDFLPLELDEEKLAASDEVTLGLETMAAVPWKMRMDFLTCVECRRCTDQCPAHGAEQELDPRGFILAGRRTLLDLGADAPVIGNVLTDQALGQCTSCGACEAICPVGIEHLQVLLGAKRAQALAIGKGMVANDFLQKVERYGNPFAAPADLREKLISDLGIPRFASGKTEWLLWLGCVWGYNQDARPAAAAMVRVLEAAGVSFGVLPGEACCGHHSRRQGEELQFQVLAKQNLETLGEEKVAKIVTPCPHCFHTLRREYPTLDANYAPEVVHHSELLARLISAGTIRLTQRPEAPVATYHDPCYLGRYEGVYDEPRQLLAAAGLPLRELTRRRERSYCCGGGSAGFAREQEGKRRVDQVRKDEIAASGAKLLVTACPECKMMLGTAVDQTKDLAEVVAEALAPAAAAAPAS